MQSIRRFSCYSIRHHRIFLRTLLPLFTVLSLVLSPMAALSQAPRSFWIPPYFRSAVPVAAPEVEATIALSYDPYPLIIDTDAGVDDAVALAWLLRYVPEPPLEPPADNILGIVTVAGNTTVENVTKNVYTVLSLTGEEDIPVVMGAKKPMSEKLTSAIKLVHGPDGLWGVQDPNASGSPLTKAKDFYCSNANHSPRATILALGPLTNIAEAIRHCGKDMKKYGRIVILGGAKFGGNTTPVAEFNFWQDPKAAQIVLESGIEIHMIPMDAFTQLGFGLDVVGIPGVPPIASLFAASPNEVFRHLAFPVAFYAATQLQAGDFTPSIPDLAAAIYAIHGPAVLADNGIVLALVEVIERPDLVRGQSIIGIGLMERVTMIADFAELGKIADKAFAVSEIPGIPSQEYLFGNPYDPTDPFNPGKINEILDRVPRNANVVVDFDEEEMAEIFLDVLHAPALPSTAQSEGMEQAPYSENIFLPSVSAD